MLLIFEVLHKYRKPSLGCQAMRGIKINLTLIRHFAIIKYKDEQAGEERAHTLFTVLMISQSFYMSLAGSRV
jgi:hypothetical protein